MSVSLVQAAKLSSDFLLFTGLSYLDEIFIQVLSLVDNDEYAQQKKNTTTQQLCISF